MTVVQTGIRADKVIEMTQPTSALRNEAGDKYLKIGSKVLDLAPSKTRDDVAIATPNASGEVIFDVNSGLTNVVIDNLKDASVTPRSGGALSTTAPHWEPQLTDSLLEYSDEAGGPFTIGETVTTPSGGSATVTGVSDDGRYVQVSGITGTFLVAEVVTGGSSSASGTLTHPTNAAAATAVQAKQRFVYALVYDGQNPPVVLTSGAQNFTWRAEGTPVTPQ